MKTTKFGQHGRSNARERGENRHITRLRRKSKSADNRQIYFGGAN